MKYWIWIFMALLLTGCGVPEDQLRNLGTAPELENEIWLNTDEPLRLSELRGSVVLLDMWTYG